MTADRWSIVFILGVVVLAVAWIWWPRKRGLSSATQFDAFDHDAIAAATAAGNLMRRFDFDELLPQHLLWALLDKPGKLLAGAWQAQHIDQVQAKMALEGMFVSAHLIPSPSTAPETIVSQEVKRIIDQAKICATARFSSQIAPIDICQALLERAIASPPGEYREVKVILQQADVMPASLVKSIREVVDSERGDRRIRVANDKRHRTEQ